MDVGLALPQYGYSLPGTAPLRWDDIVEWAQRAEAVGLGSVWLSDHLAYSIAKYGGPDTAWPGLDPLVLLAALARMTDRVRLGTLVLANGLRPPAVVAKALAGVDRLSGGRLIVGLGFARSGAEYDEAGLPFPPTRIRREQLEEAVPVIRALLSQGDTPLDHDGRHYRISGGRNEPGPAQDSSPPIWLGGRSDRLIELAARVADGWNVAWNETPETYPERLEVLERACAQIDRDPATITKSVGVFAMVGEDDADLRRRWIRRVEASPPGVLGARTFEDWRTGKLVGSVEEVRTQVARWAALGVESIVVSLGAVPFSVTDLDDLELLASSVIEESPC